MNFHFKNPLIGKPDSIIFAGMDKIFELNYLNETTKTILTYQQDICCQPQFFEMNDNQNVFLLASPDDSIYVSLEYDIEVDIDEEYEI